MKVINAVSKSLCFEELKLNRFHCDNYGAHRVIPKCKKVIDAMKKDGVSKFACIGIC